MPSIRPTRGVPLPGLWQICVFAAAVAGTWILWSEFRGLVPPAALRSGNANPGEKLRAILELSRQGRPALGELMTMLQSDERTTRRNALLALAEMGPQGEPALKTIREQFFDPDPTVRGCALMAFSRICDDQYQVFMATAGFLADPDKQQRESAARILETAGPSQIPTLIKMAHCEIPEARRLVIRRLAVVDRDRAPDEINAALRGLLDDTDAEIRLDAITAVVSRGAVQLDEVRGWLREDDPQVVGQGLLAVCSLGPDAAATLPELAALLDDTTKVRPWPADALLSIGTAARPLIPALMRRVAALDSCSRSAACEILVEIGADPGELVPLLIPLVSDKHNSNSWHAGRLIGRINPDEARRQVSRLIGQIEAREKSIDGNDPDIQLLCAMGAQAHEAVPLLIRLLSHTDSHVQVMAMETLRKIGPAAAPALPLLLAVIDRERTSHRFQALNAAIDAVGGMGPAARIAVSRLLEILNDHDPRAQYPAHAGEEAAAWALGRIGDASPEILDALRRQLAIEVAMGDAAHLQAHSGTRVAALQSFVLLAGDSATALSDLMPLLNDQDVAVRVQAILAVGRLPGDRRDAIDALIDAVAQDDLWTRTAAALALGQIGPEAAAALPVLRSFLGDCRNSVPNKFRPASRFRINVQFAPDGKDLQRLSLAEAARWAIAAIEKSGN